MGSHITVGLDVGTTKISAVVAEMNGNGLEILGVGTAPSTGMRKGMIINIEATVDSIQKAVRDAESFTGTRIKSVSVGISNGHIRGLNSSGAVGIRGKEVTVADVERAIDSAKAVYIPLDREVLHVIPTEFVLDDQEGIIDPLGMSGMRLEARVHIITGAASSIQNLIKCCTRAGLDVSDIVLKPLASVYSTLTQDEKEFGAVLVDIGGGTTDIILFKDNCPRYVSILGIGGAHLTNDIAIGLRMNMHDAERLKEIHGAATEAVIIDSAEEIEITQSAGQKRMIPRKYLAEIMQPRCEEMLEMIREEIRKCFGFELATCGVVLTGGSSLLEGFDRMAEAVLGLPVRIGIPVNTNGVNESVGSPQYATGVGLASYGIETDVRRIHAYEFIRSVFVRVKDRMKGVFR